MSGYALMFDNSTIDEKVEDIPTEVQEVLTEFTNIILKKFLQGLPPNERHPVPYQHDHKFQLPKQASIYA